MDYQKTHPVSAAVVCSEKRQMTALCKWRRAASFVRKFFSVRPYRPQKQDRNPKRVNHHHQACNNLICLMAVGVAINRKIFSKQRLLVIKSLTAKSWEDYVRDPRAGRKRILQTGQRLCSLLTNSTIETRGREQKFQLGSFCASSFAWAFCCHGFPQSCHIQ